MSQELLTRKQLAEKLNVSLTSVSRYHNQGMPVIWIASNLPRYEYEACIKWLKKRSKTVKEKAIDQSKSVDSIE